MNRTFYVHLLRQFVGGRLRTVVGVAGTRPQTIDWSTSTIAWFEVSCPTKAEADGVVMEWLLRGRPASMEVQQLRDPLS